MISNGRCWNLSLTCNPCNALPSLAQIRKELEAIQKTVKQQQSSGGGSLREVFADPVAARAAKICLVVVGSFGALGVTTVMAFTLQVHSSPVKPLQ